MLDSLNPGLRMLFGLLSTSCLRMSVNRSFFVDDSTWLPSWSRRVFLNCWPG